MVVAAVVGDQDVSVDGDGHHVHQGGRNVAVKEEWEDATESRAQGPGLVNIPGQIIRSQGTDNWQTIVMGLYIWGQ